MELNLMVAGFGGQGVMMIGKLLSQATCDSTDYNVTFFPSYGAQQRGGTANCYVVISDREVGSPKPNIVDQLVVMNDVSMVKFRTNVKAGGIIFTNSSLVHSGAERDEECADRYHAGLEEAVAAGEQYHEDDIGAEELCHFAADPVVLLFGAEYCGREERADAHDYAEHG